MQKYRPLGDFLVRQPEIFLSIAFDEIEAILGFTLPPSAHNHRAWWANSPSHPQASAWLDVGWKVDDVDLEYHVVCFRHPVIFSLNQIFDDNDAELSLKVSVDNHNLGLILSGPNATASKAFPWRQIIQMLIDVNPHLFGHLTREPDHYVFPETLAKLGYTTVNWETGESWQKADGRIISDHLAV